MASDEQWSHIARLPSLKKTTIVVSYLLLFKLVVDFATGSVFTRLNTYITTGYIVLVCLTSFAEDIKEQSRSEGVRSTVVTLRTILLALLSSITFYEVTGIA